MIQGHSGYASFSLDTPLKPEARKDWFTSCFSASMPPEDFPIKGNPPLVGTAGIGVALHMSA